MTGSAESVGAVHAPRRPRNCRRTSEGSRDAYIVIAEDAAVISAGLAEILSSSGHEVGAAVGYAEALKAAVAEHRRHRA
jgi:type IV secretory pathway TrbL component